MEGIFKMKKVKRHYHNYHKRNETERLRNRFFITGSIFLAVMLSFLFWNTFVYSYDCGNDEGCFFSYLEICGRAEFSSDTDLSLSYVIAGLSLNGCVVDISLTEKFVGQAGKIETSEMTCVVPLGTANFPEANMNLCKGGLKEEINEEIIARMNDYINQNLDSIYT